MNCSIACWDDSITSGSVSPHNPPSSKARAAAAATADAVASFSTKLGNTKLHCTGLLLMLLWVPFSSDDDDDADDDDEEAINISLLVVVDKAAASIMVVAVLLPEDVVATSEWEVLVVELQDFSSLEEE